MRLYAYLIFDGQCADAFRFYAQSLGGHLEMSTFGDAPMAPSVLAEVHARIMHARLTIGDQVLMGSDTMPEHPYDGVKGFSVSIGVDDPTEADRLFAALAAGGTVTMPIGETFFAARFGMLVDRFGVPWMVNCDQAS